MKESKILVLWAVLRSVSTAFLRMMIERNDFHVLNSAFSVYYYYSKDRVSDRYGVGPENSNTYDYREILASLQDSPEGKPVFLKDMSYYVKRCMTPEFLDNFKNTFIIRHPQYALPSLWEIMPDFTLEETGYEQQYIMFQMVKGHTRENPVVIDGDELRKNPEAVVKAYCDAVNIPYIPQALNWQAKENIPQLELWKGWFNDVNSSVGFQPPNTDGEDTGILNSNQILRDAYNHCLPFYEEMYQYKIQI